MEHKRFEGERTLMRIHIGESDKWHGKALYQAIIELLRQEKFAGATVQVVLVSCPDADRGPIGNAC